MQRKPCMTKKQQITQKKPEPPARHKDVIKKCDTKGCDLSEEDIIAKLDRKKKKYTESQKNATKANSFLFFNEEN